MKLKDFSLECYFGKYEFTAPYLLAQSDCEAMTTRELLALEQGAEAGYLDTWLGYTETWGSPALRVAVASLSDVSAVILAEGVTLEQSVIDTAAAKGVNILSSDKGTFEIAAMIAPDV